MEISPQTNLFIFVILFLVWFYGVILFLVWFYGQAGFGLRKFKRLKGKI